MPNPITEEAVISDLRACILSSKGGLSMNDLNSKYYTTEVIAALYIHIILRLDIYSIVEPCGIPFNDHLDFLAIHICVARTICYWYILFVYCIV